MDQNTSVTDDRFETLIQHQKIAEKFFKRSEIIDTMLGEVAAFGGQIAVLETEPKLIDEDYERLYHLYKAVIKALSMLEIERIDLENELENLPPRAGRLFPSSNDKVISWSQYFHKNPTPNETNGVETILSPATVRIGGMLRSVASFIGLTSEAVCLNEGDQEHIDNMKNLVVDTKIVITMLEKYRDQIVKILEPFIEKNRYMENSNPK